MTLGDVPLETSWLLSGLLLNILCPSFCGDLELLLVNFVTEPFIFYA